MSKTIKKALAIFIVICLILTQAISVFAVSQQGSSDNQVSGSQESVIDFAGSIKAQYDSQHPKVEEVDSSSQIPHTIVSQEAQSIPVEASKTSGDADVVPDKLIVKYKAGISTSAISSINSSIKATSTETNNKLGFVEVNLPGGSNVEKIAENLSRNSNIEIAEPVYYRHISVVNDTFYSKKWQWGLDAIDFNTAWNATNPTQKAAVTIAIVDSGVDIDHPELAANIVQGYDFVNNDNNPDDDNGHGTHVAGIAAAITDNGTGMAGVAGGVKIMPVKVMAKNGFGNTADIVDGILFAVNNGAKVINMSIGGGPYSKIESTAIKYAIDNGVTVVAATGNDYNTTQVSYPAAYPDVIAVGAVNWNGTDFVRADFSNCGTGLDITAPGVDILSTIPVELDVDGVADGYTLKSGTSMACPFVAGMAALKIAADNSLNCSAVQAALQASAKNMSNTASFGAGVLNGGSAAALKYPRVKMTVTGITGSNVGIDVNVDKNMSVLDAAYNGSLDVVAGKYNIDISGNFSWVSPPAVVDTINISSGHGTKTITNLVTPGDYKLFVKGNNEVMNSAPFTFKLRPDATRSISGTISLPSGTASSNIPVFLRLYKDGNYLDTITTVINSGTSSVNYTFSGLTAGSGYKICYYVFLDDYISFEFYKAGGAVLNPALSDSIDLTAGNATSKNITFVAASTISDDYSYSPSLAQTLNFNGTTTNTETRSGVINYPGDVDWFRFTVPQAGAYVIEGTGDSLPFGTLFNNSLSQIASSAARVLDKDKNTIDDDFAISATLTAGTYYVKVSSNYIDYTNKNYSLNIYNAPKITGTINLPSGCTAPTGGLKINLKALDNGTVIKEGNCIECTIPQGQSSVNYSMPVPKASEYKLLANITTDIDDYVKLLYYKWGSPAYNLNTASTFNLTGVGQPFSYNFTFPRVDTITDDYANTSAGASLLKFGVAKNGVLDYTNDADWFKFTVVNPGNYRIVSTGNYVIGNYIYDSGTKWYYYGDGKEASNTFTVDYTKNFSAGTYYIKAAIPDGGDQACSYSMKVVAASAVAPEASSVSISGTTTVGYSLTGSYTYSDDNGDTEGTSTFRWLSSDSSTGTYTAISGATSKTYTLSSSLAGKYIKFEVTPVNNQSPATGTPVLSSAVGPIQAYTAPQSDPNPPAAPAAPAAAPAAPAAAPAPVVTPSPTPVATATPTPAPTPVVKATPKAATPAPTPVPKELKVLDELPKDKPIGKEEAQKTSDAAKGLADSLLKSKGSDSQALMGSAADKLDDLAQIAKNATNKDDAKKIIDQATNVLGAINKAASQVTDAAGAAKALDSLSTALTNSTALLGAATDAAQQKAVATQIVGVLKTTSATLDKVESGEKALEVANNIVDNAAKVMAAGNGSEAAGAVTKELQNLAQSALDKAGTQTAGATVAGQVSKATITNDNVKDILNKADTLKQAEKSLEGKIASDKSANLETKLTIDVPKDQGVNTVQTVLPANLLDSIKSKGIDKVEVSTGIAAVAIPPSAISTTNAASIDLQVKQADKAKDLTKEQQAVVGNNPVFDFNLNVINKNGKTTKISKFSSNLEISVPYTLAKGQDPEKITVYFINDKGLLENKSGSYDPDSKTVTFTTEHFSKYFVKENKVNVSDIKGYEAYKKYIEVLAAKGIVIMAKGDKYSPSANVTKGELASILARALKLNAIADKSVIAKLKDVKNSDPNYNAIISVINAGLMSVDNNGKFIPSTKLTREEVALIVSNAAKVFKGAIVTGDINKFVSYIDGKQIRTIYKESVALISKYNIMDSKQGKNFKPADFVNKAEVAKIIYNLINMQ